MVKCAIEIFIAHSFDDNQWVKVFFVDKSCSLFAHFCSNFAHLLSEPEFEKFIELSELRLVRRWIKEENIGKELPVWCAENRSLAVQRSERK